MKKIQTYAIKRFEKLSDYLKSYQHIQDPELLHSIRVEIKKIKGVLNLIEFSVEKFKAHQHFIPIRTIFRSAGDIRQLDVFYRLLLRYQIEGIADAEIPNADKINSMSVAFQKSVPQFLKLIKLERKKLTKYFHKVKRSDTKDYLGEKSEELQSYLFPKFTKTSLHKARKIAKEMIYLQGLNRHSKRKAFYNKVDGIIGQWHDKQLLIQILQKSKAIDELAKLKELSSKDLLKLKQKAAHFYGN